MRKCIFCDKPMHSSLCSIWINNENYDAHKKCLNDRNFEDFKLFKERIDCRECKAMKENMVASWCKKHSPSKSSTARARSKA